MSEKSQPDLDSILPWHKLVNTVTQSFMDCSQYMLIPFNACYVKVYHASRQSQNLEDPSPVCFEINKCVFCVTQCVTRLAGHHTFLCIEHISFLINSHISISK